MIEARILTGRCMKNNQVQESIEAYEKEFRKKALERRYSEEEIKACLDYAIPLIEKELPVIYNTSHLSALVGYTKSYLKRASIYTPFFYRTFTIPKKNGKSRTIYEPLPSLKGIQQWILKNILYKVPVSKFAKAYIPHRNLLDNVKQHENRAKVVTLDIESFFPSISRERVEELFKSLGYSPILANLMAKLCTLEGYLPEGAPTSPYLSNLILRDFDEGIAAYCQEQKIRYTRYADDLTFSGKNFDEKELINLVKKNLSNENLRLNSSKTSIMKKGQRQVVTGITVNDKIQVPKLVRKELRQSIYYIRKYGLKDHLRKINCQKNNYLQHLLGVANYILFINPNDKETEGYRDFIEKQIELEKIELLKNSLHLLADNPSPQEWPNAYKDIQTKIPQGVFCLLTAAFHYDLTTFIPSGYYVAIPEKSRAALPEYPPIELFYWKEIDHSLGMINVEIEEEAVKMYDIEKTVCDMIKHRKVVGEDLALEVLKNYLNRRKRNLVKISQYADELGIKDKLSTYLTVLL